VLVLDNSAQPDLDPRGTNSISNTLDEQQTARYLTSVRRMAKRKPSPISIATTEYLVVA